jgi:hypothetical protein
MSPDDFIAQWHGVTLTERPSPQKNFTAVCGMPPEKISIRADPPARPPLTPTD